MTHHELRTLWSAFWEKKGHKLVPPAPLVLQNDPTTLFTSSGMQPLIENLNGQPHQLGNRLYNIQPCFRSGDIDEVGDNRHTTFFEMMGNWSLGDYFKEDQLAWIWEFFTKELTLPKEKLYVSVFEGSSDVPRDEESASIWKNLGGWSNPGGSHDHIYFYGAAKNWWSRSGTPDKMPVGEIGGPDSEVFYDFGAELKLHENSLFKDQQCHPNCDCGRFLEIGNSVFIQYKKAQGGSIVELQQKNIDYGGGLERILAACNNDPDIFRTDVFSTIIQAIEKVSQKSYEDTTIQHTFRVIGDHMKAATFFITEGIVPSNKEHGYVLRRLLRRTAIKMRQLQGSFTVDGISMIARAVLSTYGDTYFDAIADEIRITQVIDEEMKKFSQSLEKGLTYFNKFDKIDEKIAFDLFQNFGFPFEITQELVQERQYFLDSTAFGRLYQAHQNQSRTASAGTFKGGLADQSQQVLKYHTATHLLHQALRDVLGSSVRQEGSNITGERLRFDFYVDKKPSDEAFKKVEQIVNEKISQKLPVEFKIMPKSEAEKIGALYFFKEKYGTEVKVYFVGDYSKEFCGGPHVHNTGEIGNIKITKVKKIGANLMRIYAE